MLFRVLSDIHGNWPALSAVLADPPGSKAGRTICLGDVVGYGADPERAVSKTRTLCDTIVAGNHDSGVAGIEPLDRFNRAGAAAASWTKKRLTAADRAWLASLPLTVEIGTLLLCHSYPPDPGSFAYIMHTAQARECCRQFPGRVMLVGHTHLPRVWMPDGSMSEAGSGAIPETCVINAGSVGQPRDGDPRAAYLLIDTSEKLFRHMRVDYDIDAAASSIRDAGLPEILWRRLYLGQ
jgi:diadenosine tetraphosphatase ApaH/serine/threonine PP2A family protein phosphatase